MEVLRMTDHQDCFHSENKMRPTVEIRELEQGYKDEVIFRKNEIVFMIEGEVEFTFRDHAPKLLRGGEFIFIPMGGVFSYSALKKTIATVIRLNGHITLCGGCRIEELYTQGGAALKKKRAEIHALEINRPLWHYLLGLNKVVQGGLNCRYYFDIKAKEVLILLKSYYSLEELQDFFATILSPDMSFSEHVRATHHQYRTVGELAASMNISPKHFVRVFTRVFGTSPGKWLNGERAQMIYNELHSGQKSFKQIAYEQGFSTQQQLNRFCKRELGKNPGEIRRGKKGK